MQMTGKTESVTVFFLLSFSLVLAAAELNVGKKVVYPGGADQPPKEKDTGIKLKVDVISATTFSKEDDTPDQEEMEKLLQEGDGKKLLETTANRSDPVSKAYEAMALLSLGKNAEGERKGKKLLESGELEEDLKASLEEALEKAASGKEKPDKDQ